MQNGTIMIQPNFHFAYRLTFSWKNLDRVLKWIWDTFICMLNLSIRKLKISY